MSRYLMLAPVPGISTKWELIDTAGSKSSNSVVAAWDMRRPGAEERMRRLAAELNDGEDRRAQASNPSGRTPPRSDPSGE